MRFFCSILILSLFINALGATVTVSNYFLLDSDISTLTADSNTTESLDDLDSCCSADKECNDDEDCCGDDCDCQCCHSLALPTLQVSQSEDCDSVSAPVPPSTRANFHYQSKIGLNHVKGLFQPPRT